MQNAISNVSTILTAMLGWITDIFDMFMSNEFISTYFYFLLATMLIMTVIGIILMIVHHNNKN